jgi:hypothetical protein
MAFFIVTSTSSIQNIRMRRILLLLFTVFVFLQVSFANSHDSMLARLNAIISTDTFPLKLNHQTAQQLASYTLNAFKLTPTDNETYTQKFITTYWYHLLSNNIATADSLFLIADKKNDNALPGMRGYRALYKIIKGISSPISSKDSIQIDDDLTVAISFNAEPIAVWKWLKNMFNGPVPAASPYEFPFKEPEFFKGIKDSPALNYDGAMLPFEISKGKLALLISSGKMYEPVQLWIKNKTGVWENKTQESGLKNYPGGTRIYAVDYNNDGYKDLMILRATSRAKYPIQYPSSLLKNNGNGTFEDVTISAGMFFMGKALSAIWGDFNNDGLNDVFVGLESQPSKFYIQNPDHTFTESAFSLGINSNKAPIADGAALDFNNDGLMDLFLSVKGAKNKVFIQEILEGKYRFFIDKTSDYGKMAEPFYGGKVWAGCFDGGSEPDVLVQTDASQIPFFFHEIRTGLSSGGLEPQMLFLRSDSGKIQDYMAMAELYVASAGALLHRNDGFYMISGGGNGPEQLFPLAYGPILNGTKGNLRQTFRNLDYRTGFISSLFLEDEDGDSNPDLWLQSGGKFQLEALPPMVMKQKEGNHHYLKITLQGKTVNRDALGAILAVYIKKADGSELVFHHIVQAPVNTGNGNNASWWYLEPGDKVYKTIVKWPGISQEQIIDKIPDDISKMLIVQGVSKVIIEK